MFILFCLALARKTSPAMSPTKMRTSTTIYVAFLLSKRPSQKPISENESTTSPTSSSMINDDNGSNDNDDGQNDNDDGQNDDDDADDDEIISPSPRRRGEGEGNPKR